MSMEVTSINKDNNTIAVVVINTTSIKVGDKRHMSPSYGYCCDPGVVEVTDLISPENLSLPLDPHLVCTKDYYQARKDIEEFKRIELDGMDDADVINYMNTCTWIQYKYPFDKENKYNTYVFPVQDFVDHTSIM